MFNEECSVDVQHLCEEHINIPVVHHHDPEPHYGPPLPLPEPHYGPPPPKPHYGPPPPAAPEPHYGPPSGPEREPHYGPPAVPEPLYGPTHSHGPFTDKPHPDPLYLPPELPKPIFSFPKPVHHDPHFLDKSKTVSVHDFASIYKTSFSQHFRRIRRQVAGEAESLAIFPQLSGQVLSEKNSNFLSTQETQLSNIVKVHKS